MIMIVRECWTSHKYLAIPIGPRLVAGGSAAVDDVGVVAEVHPAGLQRPDPAERAAPRHTVAGLAGQQVLVGWPGELVRRVRGVTDEQVGPAVGGRPHA